MSSKLPAIKPKQLLRALERAGFRIHHVTGSHYVLKNESTGARVVLPWHNRDLKRGTLHAILDQAGLSADDLLKVL